MKKKYLFIITYLLIFFNSNLFASEGNKILKIGLLTPLSGEYRELGNSFLFSLQLALEEINDSKVIIIPRDSGFNNKEKLNLAINEIRSEGAEIIIGPMSNEDFDEIKKYSDLIFISPSNIEPAFTNNVISVGVSLESQLLALSKFIKKQKKTKTIVMYPKNQYASIIERKLKSVDLENIKTFKYNPDPEVLTGEIETMTNYNQRKKNLEIRKKIFEDKEDEASLKELARLEQLYTLGKVNFDSVIIIDFGNSLKSVLTSLVYTDVNQSDVLFTTVNQWFDESIFYENTIKSLYYPSINYKQFKKYNKKYFETFKKYPNEITILAYDALGLIYYAWKKMEILNLLTIFHLKIKLKVKLGLLVLKIEEYSKSLIFTN